MNHDPTEIRWREVIWRGELSEADRAGLRAWLEAHPEEQARWQEDATLNTLLARLPEAPMPTNFTARVMGEIESARLKDTRVARPGRWWWHALLPRLALAATAIVLVAGLGIFRWNSHVKEMRLVEGLVAVANTERVLSQETLQDFDAILQLGPRAQADTELLHLMQ